MDEHHDSFATYLAMELRAECARKRLSGRFLAHHIHRPVTTVSRWLNGTTPIGVDDLARVCASIGISVSEIAQRAEALQRATSATPAASVTPISEEVTSVTKRYVSGHLRDTRPHLSRSDILRLPRGLSAKGADSGIDPYRDMSRCHKLAS